MPLYNHIIVPKPVGAEISITGKEILHNGEIFKRLSKMLGISNQIFEVWMINKAIVYSFCCIL